MFLKALKLLNSKLTPLMELGLNSLLETQPTLVEKNLGSEKIWNEYFTELKGNF